MMVDHHGDGTLASACARFQSITEDDVAGLPLDAGERQWAQEHAVGCPECARLATVLDLLAETPAELAEGADQVERAVRHRLAAAARPVRRWGAAAAIAAMLLVGVSWAVRERLQRSALSVAVAEGVAFLEMNGRVLEVGETLNLAQPVVAGRDGARFTVPDTMQVELDPMAKMRLAAVSSRSVALHLAQGRGGFNVDPERRARVVVSTPQGEIVVKGTVFTLAVDARETYLEVQRGVVTARGTEPARPPVDVPAGWSWSSGSGVMTRTREEPKDVILQAVEGVNEVQDIVERDAVRAKPPRVRRPAVIGKGAPNASATPTAATLIAQAQKCRLLRQWQCAARAYRRLVLEYPDGPDALLILLPLADLEREHLGDPAAAVRHYDRYLAARPTGSLVNEALYGKTKALRVLGRVEEERAVLQQILTTDGGEPYAQAARTRLRELESMKVGP